MRLVQVTVPTGKRDAIVGVLQDEGIDYVIVDEVSGQGSTAVVEFPLPSGAIEPVLAQLREAGLPDDAYTIIIDAETVISRRFDELVERYEEDETGTERISREEIRATARDLVPRRIAYVIMVIVSAGVATAGVLLDSAAVVVGSMVIAPLIGPAMATSVGTVLGDRDMFVRGTRYQVVGFAVSVVAATAFAWLVKALHLAPLGPTDLLAIEEVRERLAPDFLSLAVALGAGVAGAYSLSAGVSSALVGVMIAAALVPPVAVIGIGVAWGLPTVVAGSTLLVLVNFVSINLAALAVFWYQGYRPAQWFREDEARTATFRRVAVLLVVIGVLSAFLGVVTYSSYQAAADEQAIRGDVEQVLSASRYDDLSLIEVTVDSESTLLTRRIDRVIVTVGRPPGASAPGLADDIANRVGDPDIGVEVRFVERVTAGR